MNDKHEQALQRAQENIANKREQYRNNNRKVKKVNERRMLLESRRRNQAMHSIENRLNMALTRAEENLKKKQGRARHSKRIQKAQNKRALIEFERRSALLDSLGHKNERATRNLQLRLEDLQDKARCEIEHAHEVAKRVKAVRVLQKAVRVNLFGLKDQSDQSELITTAALRLQNCKSWKTKVIASRLSRNNDLGCVSNLLGIMGILHDDGSATPSFEELTAAITNIASLQSANSLLDSLGPLLRNSANLMKPEILSPRTLLSVFLVALQPDEVLGDKRDTDKCSKLLESAAKELIKSLVELSKVEEFTKSSYCHNRVIIQEVCSKILSYCTFFDKWKNADFDDLLEKMTKSAQQSWVAFLTSKQALLYIEETFADQNGPFQHLLKYKSSRKGAGSHIKRVRVAMNKLMGEGQSLKVMREAKQAAVTQIEEEQLMVAIKAEIDSVFNSFGDDATCEDDDSSMAPKSKPKQGKEKMPESVLSNSNLVHKILLMDSEDFEDLSKHGTAEKFSHFRTAKHFMMHYKNYTSASEEISDIKQLMVDLINKMRELVPSREDLQQYFTEDQVDACNTTADYFGLTLNMANVMMKSLESEYRSVSTLEWYEMTSVWNNHADDSIPYDFGCWKSFLTASLAFLIGKVDLCQMDVVNFKLVQIAPVVRANGKEYEIQRFQEKFGELSSFKSSNSFVATWNWIRRIKENNKTDDLITKFQEGFVDEILFSTEATAVPEVRNKIHRLIPCP